MRSGAGHPAAQGRAGFTLLEVAVYVTVLTVIGAPLVSLILTSSRSTSENETFSRVEDRNRTALFRMEKEIRKALSGTAVISNSGKRLVFTSPGGFDGTGPIAGPQVSFAFRVSQGETLNGVDDNDNGIADEGELVRTDIPTGTETLITGAIDVQNSSFALNGNGVTINVTSFGSLDRRYGAFSASRNVTVYPRN